MTCHGRIANDFRPGLLSLCRGKQCHACRAMTGCMVGMHGHPVFQRSAERARLVELNGDCIGPLSWLFGDPITSTKFLKRCSDQIKRTSITGAALACRLILHAHRAYAQRLFGGEVIYLLTLTNRAAVHCTGNYHPGAFDRKGAVYG